MGFLSLHYRSVNVYGDCGTDATNLARLALSVLDSAVLAAITALVIFIFYRDLSPRVREFLESANSDSTEGLDSSADAGRADWTETYDDGKRVYKSETLAVVDRDRILGTCLCDCICLCPHVFGAALAWIRRMQQK